MVMLVLMGCWSNCIASLTFQAPHPGEAAVKAGQHQARLLQDPHQPHQPPSPTTPIAPTSTIKCCKTFTGLIHEKDVILSSTPKGNICKPKTKQTSLFLDFSQHLFDTAFMVFKVHSPPVAPNCWRGSFRISKFYSPHLKWVLHWETGENSLKCVWGTQEPFLGEIALLAALLRSWKPTTQPSGQSRQ